MDALAISRRLRDAGLEQPAAEAITSAIRDAVDSSAAAKTDLDNAVERLDAKIDRLDAKVDRVFERLEAKIEESVQALELKMVWWIVGAGGLFALLQVAARYLLP